MKKQISLIFLTALLAACSSPKPNLVHTNTPILNITAELDPLVEANASMTSAYVKNKTAQPLGISYLLTWYDKQGVTQLMNNQMSETWQSVRLNPKEKHHIILSRPTVESVNYRLYLK